MKFSNKKRKKLDMLNSFIGLQIKILLVSHAMTDSIKIDQIVKLKKNMKYDQMWPNLI